MHTEVIRHESMRVLIDGHSELWLVTGENCVALERRVAQTPAQAFQQRLAMKALPPRPAKRVREVA